MVRKGARPAIIEYKKVAGASPLPDHEVMNRD
jgi:hypothetical protein